MSTLIAIVVVFVIIPYWLYKKPNRRCPKCLKKFPKEKLKNGFCPDCYKAKQKEATRRPSSGAIHPPL